MNSKDNGDADAISENNLEESVFPLQADEIKKQLNKVDDEQAETPEKPLVTIDPSDDIPNNTDKSIDF